MTRDGIKFYIDNYISNDKESIAETLTLLTPQFIKKLKTEFKMKAFVRLRIDDNGKSRLHHFVKVNNDSFMTINKRVEDSLVERCTKLAKDLLDKIK